MKKYWLFAIPLVLGVGILLFLLWPRESKFSLEKEYYNKNGLVDVSREELEKLVKEKKSFVVFTYNDFCTFAIPCDEIFEEGSKKAGVEILQLSFRDFKKTSLVKTVKIAPSVMVIHDGKIVKYLDAEKKEDYEYYQDAQKFEDWLRQIVETEG